LRSGDPGRQVCLPLLPCLPQSPKKFWILPCHHMPPTTRLVPSACVHSACARDARRAVSFPNAHSFRKFQASACTVAQRRQAHVGACRAHSLGPRNRLPSSTTHTRAVLLGPPPSVKRRRSQPPSSRMLGTATVLRGLWQVAVTGSRCGTPFCSRKQASKPRRPACCRQHT